MSKACVFLAWVAVMFGASNGFGQSVTPNLGLYQPAINSTGWGAAVNSNFGIVDNTAIHVVYGSNAGMKCDDTTDDTSVLNTILTNLYNGGGGTLIIQGKCLISGSITIPNSGATQPTAPALRITGLGPSANGQWTTLPAIPSALDLRYNDSYAKLKFIAIGQAEIDHVGLIDGGSDCAAFILTTNTSVNIHDVVFSGTASGVSACNDAVIFGGTTTTIGGAVADAFQGYHSIETHNFFDKVRRGALLQVYANNIWVNYNTFSTSCGTNQTSGGAIEINSGGASTNIGNHLSFNLIETPYYYYGVRLVSSGADDNVMIGNGCFDGSGHFVACVRFESGAIHNYSEANFAAAFPQASDGNSVSDNLIIDPSGNEPSSLPNYYTFSNSAYAPAVTFKPGATTVYGPELLASDGGFTYNIFTSGTNPVNYLYMSTEGGTPYSPFAVAQIGTTTTFTFGAASNTSTLLSGQAGSDVHLRAPSGQTLWICDLCNEVIQVGASGYTTNFKSSIESAGTTFTTNNGCSETTLVGGTQAGSVHSGTSGTCTFVVTMGGSVSATHGWSCWANDLTTPADVIKQTSVSGSTATFSGTTVSGDVINFGCLAY